MPSEFIEFQEVSPVVADTKTEVRAEAIDVIRDLGGGHSELVLRSGVSLSVIYQHSDLRKMITRQGAQEVEILPEQPNDVRTDLGQRTVGGLRIDLSTPRPNFLGDPD